MSGYARRVNAVTIELELRQRGGQTTFIDDPYTGRRVITGKTPEFLELAICGEIWNARHTNIVCAGQCLDAIAEYRQELSDPETFDVLYDLWKKYHLNGAHAGTPEQERAIEEWKRAGNRYDYDAVCEMLKACGLYEVNYTGLSVGRRFNNEPYRYGTAWLVQELPSEVIQTVEKLVASHAV